MTPNIGREAYLLVMITSGSNKEVGVSEGMRAGMNNGGEVNLVNSCKAPNSKDIVLLCRMGLSIHLALKCFPNLGLFKEYENTTI